MKKIISVFCAVALIVSYFAFSAGALTKDDANTALAGQNSAFTQIIKERLDVNGSGKIEAADARLVLLASVGHVEESLVPASNADIDGDGKVTAIDARIFLRLAAALEPVEKYLTVSDAEKLEYFNAVMNSIKPNAYKYYAYTVTKNPKITHNNQALINDINSQMNNLSSLLMGGETEDFGKELTTPVPDVVANATSYKTASRNTYPVRGSDLASLVTLDNVKKIEYKLNDIYKIDTKVYSSGYYAYSDTVTGLDSITVYLKDDAAVPLKESGNETDSLHAAKLLDVLNDFDIAQMLNKNKTEVESLNDTFAGIGKCEFKFTPKSLRYHDSYVKVYFDHATGTPIGIEYSLTYNVVMNIDMFIDIKASDIIGSSLSVGQLLKVDGDMDLDSEMIYFNSFYFFNNNPDHAEINKG